MGSHESLLFRDFLKVRSENRLTITPKTEKFAVFLFYNHNVFTINSLRIFLRLFS